MQVGYHYKLTTISRHGTRYTLRESTLPRQATCTYYNKVGYQQKHTMQKQATHCKKAHYEGKLRTVVTRFGAKIP